MGLFMRDEPVPVNRARSARFNQHRAITASAERIDLSNPKAGYINRSHAEWQAAAWIGYRRVGEVHYGFSLLANLLSRVRLYAAVVGEANESPRDVTSDALGVKTVSSGLAEAAAEAMADLTAEDFASFIRKFSLNLSVPGECYLVHMPDVDKPTERTWRVCSTSEITIRGGGSTTYTPMRGEAPRTLPKDTFIARMWRQNPEYSREADSSMVGVADSVEELLLCQRLVRGAARSRMNAGLVFLPDGLTVARTSTTGEPVLEEPEDSISGLAAMAQQDPGNDLATQLMDSMVTPIGDEGSAAGVVPLILIGQTDQGQAIRHVSFERGSDEWLVKRAETALDRILQGIDIPKEIVTGMQAVKYSNAVVIDENLYKSNIEPLALVLADSLTQVYLRPVLKSQGFSDEQLRNIVIWYDPSEIVTRPNSATSANEGWDRGILGSSAWRRENGFAESDAPDAEDAARLLLGKLNVLPDSVTLQLLEKVLKGYVKVDTDLEEPQQQMQQGANGRLPVEPAQAPADPQRTAIQQVGVEK